MDNKIYIGDTPEIILDLGEDVSTATVKQIKYKKPATGTIGFWDASIIDNTKYKYQTQNGDIDEAGIWEFMTYTEMPNWKGHGETVSYEIHNLFE